MQKTVKKLLILGGSTPMVELVEDVKSVGIKTIVSDQAIGAPAKNCADHSYNISPSNIKELVEIGKREGVDGVHALLGDVTTWNALALCKRLDIPFYVAKEQWGNSAAQDKFEDYCRTFGVSVVDEKALTDAMESAVLEFPVLLTRYAGKQSAYAIL